MVGNTSTFLLNPSSASAGLKLRKSIFDLLLQSTKPFFGFGWIETSIDLPFLTQEEKLLNPSSASAGLKLIMAAADGIFYYY